MDISDHASEIDRLLDYVSDEDDDAEVGLDLDDLDFAQNEFQSDASGDEEEDNTEEEGPEEIMEEGGGDVPERGRRRPRRRAPPEMIWEGMETYDSVRENFYEATGPQIPVDSILNTFLYFFDNELIDTIVTETNRYAEQDMAKRGHIFARFSRSWKWTPCTSAEIYVLLALYMLMSIIVKPTIRSYFSKNPLLHTKIFPSTMTGERFELLCKFLHFSNNEVTVPDIPKKLSKIHTIITHLIEKFQSAYVMSQNIALDESLLLWKGRLSIRQYIPLKAARFGIKSFELCESSTGYT